MKILYFITALLLCIISISCNRKDSSKSDNYDTERIESLDTARPLTDSVVADKPDNTVKKDFSDQEYVGGILPRIQEASSEYAERLAAEGGDGFIVVDKARMKVILYDAYGMPVKSYGMACAKNYGNKHRRGDSRTPEGFFTVQGVYDSTDWLFTDDNGRTSKVKGQFGPRFIRLSIPTTSQIGIHGTRAPWSIGHRVSHGCIRITNEQIMELVDLVHPGMPVIVIPGKRDRLVNAKEGKGTVYFPTSPGYEISSAEYDDHRRRMQSERESTKNDSSAAETSPVDTLGKKESGEKEHETPSEPTDTTQVIYF